jgi:alcohol dehydrogenase (NADP+)/uncharacterized zinc-type alcohol dehydrogenase-like protein
MECESKNGEEQHCETTGMVGTYGAPEKSSPTGITQRRLLKQYCCYRTFGIKKLTISDLQHAAPLLCAGITTYSPLIKAKNKKKGDKVGVIGISGLGHMAVGWQFQRCRGVCFHHITK